MLKYPFLLSLLVLFPFLPVEGYGADGDAPPRFQPDQEILRIEEIDRRHSRGGLDLAEVETLAKEVLGTQENARACIGEVEQELERVSFSLEAIGPEAHGESREILQQRKNLLKTKKELERRLSECKFLDNRSGGLAVSLELTRQSLASRLVYVKGKDVVSLFKDVVRERDQLPDDIRGLFQGFAFHPLAWHLWWAIPAVTLCGLGISFAIRGRILAKSREGKESVWARGVIFPLTLSFLAHVPALLAVGLIPVALFILSAGRTFPRDLPAGVFALGMICFFLLRAIFKAILCPPGPAVSWVSIDPQVARSIFRRIELVAGLFFLEAGIGYLSRTGLLAGVLHDLLLSIWMGTAVFAVFILFSSLPRLLPKGTVFWMRRVSAPWAVLVTGSFGFGYVNLAVYLIHGTAWSLAVYLVFFSVSRMVDSFFGGISEGALPWQHRVRTILGISRGSRSMGFFFARILVCILVWGGAILSIMGIWTTGGKVFNRVIALLFEGFQVGGLRLIPFRILLGAIGFVALWFVIRWIRERLENRWLDASRFEPGALEAIVTTTGYAGFVLAAITAITMAGFDLSNLAIIAGALSVGIGFGLQNIVNNFISGIILLFERPIKRGDWIVVGSSEGYVKKISVRSTVIQTFDRADVIVPNSEILSNQVTNWMFDNPRGRVHVLVGVAYGSDMDLVKRVLEDVAAAHPDVIKDGSCPPPQAWLKDFGPSSIDFDLNFFIRNVDRRIGVGSEIRYAIETAFRNNGITIPFPQQDVYVREMPVERG